jgi:succinoglycan biosynthesis protein ExoM
MGLEIMPPSVTVIICTYKRISSMINSIYSVIDQDIIHEIYIELVVVDNNHDRRVRTIVEEIAAKAPFPVRYVHEDVASISRARNTGIRAAHGQFVAFLDDDEIATPGWIRALLKTAHATAADLVFGPVKPIFEDGTPPAWDPTGSRYGTGLALPDGEVAPILGEFGHAHRLGVVGAGNVLAGRGCLQDPEPFDPAFGSSGGEDVDFFRRQIGRGRRAAWSKQAVVYEYVPRERAELGYMLRRNFRESQTFVNIMVKNSKRPHITAIRLEIRGAVQAALWAFPYFLFPILPRELALRARFSFMRGTGKLLWRRALRSRNLPCT